MSVKVYYIILFGHDVHQYFLCDLKTTEIASCFFLLFMFKIQSHHTAAGQ